MHPAKRPRNTYGPRLERKGPRLFQMVDEIRSPDFAIVADYADALTQPGAWIFDNTFILGHLQTGALLHKESRFYLVFTSPSDFSITQLKTVLQTFHDTETTTYIADFFDSFDMVIEAKRFGHSVNYSSPTPRTHACLEIDFSKIQGLYPETEEAVKKTINSVIHAAIKSFITRYRARYPLPARESTADASNLLLEFLEWLTKKKVVTALFVTVCHMDKILGRFLNAAMWERYSGSTLSERISTLRGLVLVPLLQHLGSPTGVVRKLLVVGPYMMHELLERPPDGDLSVFPIREEISRHPTLNGFTTSQIRTVFRIDEKTVPPELMDQFLAHCNLVYGAKYTERRYTPESVFSVFNTPHFDRLRPGVSLANLEGHFFEAYLSHNRKEAAARALYPLLRTNSAFRSAIADLLTEDKALAIENFRGPVCSLGQLIAPLSIETMSLRAVIMGLVVPASVARGKPPKAYVLAGGCARALLRHAFDQSTHPQPTLKVDAVSTASLTRSLTEQEVADLVLEHYRDTPASELPIDEAGFQRHFVQILRAVLLKHYGKSGFPSDVQIEVWLRKDFGLDDNGHRRSDVVSRVRCSGHDWLYIFELKYFNPKDTMDATHAYIKQLNEKRYPNEPYVLRSQSCPDAEKQGVFCHEVCSMRDVPAHWYVAAGLPRVQLGFTFVPHHIYAFYNELSRKPGGKEDTVQGDFKLAAGETRKVKQAVGIARGTGKQVVRYRDAAALGVQDQYSVGKGFSDSRFTDLGEGTTIIVPFTVVNVVGGLVYVEKHKEKKINRRVAVVDAYPWTPDPSKEDTDRIYKVKKKLP